MITHKRANPEVRAIMRSASRSTVVEIVLLAFLAYGLVEGAASVSKSMTRWVSAPPQALITAIVSLAFVGALAFVIWSFSRRRRTWADQLKNVVPLETFLKCDPAKSVLAPNLGPDERTSLLRNLQAIGARTDVRQVLVGLLPDEGNVSDRVLIKTYAPIEVIRQWPTLLGTGFQKVSSYKYEIDGKRRKVRSVLFVWD